MLAAVGPDIGFDSINDRPLAEPLSRLLDAQARQGGLPKPFSNALNPRDNEVIGTMIGNFRGRHAGQDAVRLRLVVQRSEGRHAAPNDAAGPSSGC